MWDLVTIDHRLHVDKDASVCEGGKESLPAHVAKSLMRHGKYQSVELTQAVEGDQIEIVFALGIIWTDKGVHYRGSDAILEQFDKDSTLR